jgi:hypothetical protein
MHGDYRFDDTAQADPSGPAFDKSLFALMQSSTRIVDVRLCACRTAPPLSANGRGVLFAPSDRIGKEQVHKGG